MMDQELKEFIALVIADLKTDIGRLTSNVKELSVLTREIEIKSITRVTELQKDIDDIRKDIVDVKSEVKSLTDSQKFKWKTLSEERRQEMEDRAEKDEKQAVVNSSLSTLNKVLWAIFMMVFGLVAGFIWQLIVNGGVKGIVP